MAEAGPQGPILVTGAAGFVGGHLLPVLADRFPHSRIVTAAADLRDPASIDAMVRNTQPACCIHLAAIASLAQAAEDEAAAWQVNLHGTLHLARAIVTHAPACQMIFASSSDAYGASFRSGLALDERAALNPISLYGATKAAADLALGSMAARGLRAVRLRLFNHIGPGQSPAYAVASFARQIARIRRGAQPPVIRTGRLDTSRDFLDVRDVCTAYAACVARADELAPGVVINIGSGVARRMRDVLDDLMETAGIEAAVQSEAPLVRATDITVAVADVAYAAAALGWQPAIAWGETLASVLRDWESKEAVLS